MECSQTEWLSDREYMQRFNQKTSLQRIPISGSLGLTHRCNLGCVHCYLGTQSGPRKQTEGELSATQWISILDEIAEAGCLFLLLTGGEPLLRSDFDSFSFNGEIKVFHNFFVFNIYLEDDKYKKIKLNPINI